jgi:hypothetical protein
VHYFLGHCHDPAAVRALEDGTSAVAVAVVVAVVVADIVDAGMRSLEPCGSLPPPSARVRMAPFPRGRAGPPPPW